MRLYCDEYAGKRDGCLERQHVPLAEAAEQNGNLYPIKL
jgi:hypothetical protein